MQGSDVAEAYKDVIERFLGTDKPMRFIEAPKPGLLKRLFGGSKAMSFLSRSWARRKDGQHRQRNACKSSWPTSVLGAMPASPTTPALR